MTLKLHVSQQILSDFPEPAIDCSGHIGAENHLGGFMRNLFRCYLHMNIVV
jgi:hypothetical protein